MKTLKDYTSEIKNKIPIYKEKCIKDLYNGTESKNWKREDAVNYIEYVYKLAKQTTTPVVIIADSILDYKIKFNLLFQKNSKYIKIVNVLCALKSKRKIKLNSKLSSELNLELNSKLDSELDLELYSELDSELYSELNSKLQTKYHYLFLFNEYARVYLMWYKFIKDEFNIKCTKEKELNWLYENINKANIAKGFFCKNVVLILRMPTKILRNEIGFHCITNDGAIQYKNEKFHYLNGRSVPNWVFNDYFNKTLSFKQFISEKNEDVKACILTLIKENEGNEGLLKFLKAKVIDEQTLIHANGYSEVIKLYKTKDSYSFLVNSKGERNQPYAWTEMICPSTGQTYLIDTCPLFTNALDSIKFHRPKNIPFSMPYIWQSAN